MQNDEVAAPISSPTSNQTPDEEEEGVPSNEKEDDGSTVTAKSLEELARSVGINLGPESVDIPDKTAVVDPSAECINPALLEVVVSQHQADMLSYTYNLKEPLKIGDYYIRSPFHILFSQLPISAYVRVGRVLSQIMSDPRGVNPDLQVTHPINIRDLQRGGPQAVWEHLNTLIQLYPNVFLAFLSRSGCVTTLGDLKKKLLTGELNETNARPPDEIVKSQERMKSYMIHVPKYSGMKEMWPLTWGYFDEVPYSIALGGPYNGQVLVPSWDKIADVILGKFKPPGFIEDASEEQIREWWVPISNPSMLTHLTGNLFDEHDEETIKKSEHLPKMLPYMRASLAAYLRKAVAVAQLTCAYSTGVMATALHLYGDKKKNGLF